MYRICKSYSDQSVCVAELAEACSRLKYKLGYSGADARTVALDNMVGIARSSQMVLNLLDSWTRGDEVVRQVIPQLIGLQIVTVDGVKTSGDLLNTSSRLGFGVLEQFQIENLFRNIARGLTLPSAGIGFYRTANGVLKHVGVAPDRMETLNTPARIRNSLHANGIHHRQHASEVSQVIVRGVTYDFVDGEPVTCAAWEHIAHALEASVGVLEEVCLTAPVRAIEDPLMDHYAWEQETKPTRAI